MKRFASPAGTIRISLSMADEVRHLLYMLSRRALARLAFAATAASALDVAARETLRASLLFSIGRSKNANVVRYQARFSSRGLEPARPIDAFWLMLAEDGRREELSWAERELAYGFSVTNVGPSACTLRLTAFEARSVLVERHRESFRAIIVIAGRRAVLKRIFVRTDEGTLLPSVQHVDLFGTTLHGAPLNERIRPR
jgi:hypothetical protein